MGLAPLPAPCHSSTSRCCAGNQWVPKRESNGGKTSPPGLGRPRQTCGSRQAWLGGCCVGVEGEVSGCLGSSIQGRETPFINTPETNRKQESSWRSTCSAAQGESEERFGGRAPVWGRVLNSALEKCMEVSDPFGVPRTEADCQLSLH